MNLSTATMTHITILGSLVVTGVARTGCDTPTVVDPVARLAFNQIPTGCSNRFGVVFVTGTDDPALWMSAGSGATGLKRIVGQLCTSSPIQA